jgi:DNA-binding NarL/FixJ family response regulator
MVLDVHLRDGSGVVVCRAVRAIEPFIKGVLLTADEGDEATLSAAIADAHACVLKEAHSFNLAGVLRQVAAGQRLLETSVLRQFVERLSALRHDSGQLSQTDSEILDHVLDDLARRVSGHPMSVLDSSLEQRLPDLIPKLASELRKAPSRYN